MQSLVLKVSEWETMGAGKMFIPSGPVIIRLSQPGSLLLQIGAKAVPFAYGTEFKLTTDAKMVGASVPYTYHVPVDTSVRGVRADKEILTNEDKRPTLSSAEQAVTLALRRLKRTERVAAEKRRDDARKRKAAKALADAKEREAQEQEAGAIEATATVETTTPTE